MSDDTPSAVNEVATAAANQPSSAAEDAPAAVSETSAADDVPPVDSQGPPTETPSVAANVDSEPQATSQTPENPVTAAEEPDSQPPSGGAEAAAVESSTPEQGIQEIVEEEDSQSEIKMIADKVVLDSIEKGQGDDAVTTELRALTIDFSCSHPHLTLTVVVMRSTLSNTLDVDTVYIVTSGIFSCFVI